MLARAWATGVVRLMPDNLRIAYHQSIRDKAQAQGNGPQRKTRFVVVVYSRFSARSSSTRWRPASCRKTCCSKNDPTFTGVYYMGTNGAIAGGPPLATPLGTTRTPSQPFQSLDSQAA